MPVKIRPLPTLATLALISLFFIRNIAIDDNTTVWSDSEEHTSINDLGESNVETKGAFLDQDDFESFLYGLGSKPLKYESVRMLDTTGDGEKEEVYESVSLLSDHCLVKQKITKGKQVLWDNEFKLLRKDLDWYFDEKTLNSGLEEYAMFYLGMTHVKFIQKLDQSIYSERIIKKICRHYFENAGLKVAEMYKTPLYRSLENYNGYYLFDRSPGNASIYIWNEEDERFVQVFESNHIANLI